MMIKNLLFTMALSLTIIGSAFGGGKIGLQYGTITGSAFPGTTIVLINATDMIVTKMGSDTLFQIDLRLDSSWSTQDTTLVRGVPRYRVEIAPRIGANSAFGDTAFEYVSVTDSMISGKATYAVLIRAARYYSLKFYAIDADSILGAGFQNDNDVRYRVYFPKD